MPKRHEASWKLLVLSGSISRLPGTWAFRFCRERGIWLPRERMNLSCLEQPGRPMEGTLAENLQSAHNQQCTHPGQDLGKHTYPPKGRAQSEKGPVKWESEGPGLIHRPRSHSCIQPSFLRPWESRLPHLDSEMVQGHLLSASFGIIKSVTAWSAASLRLLEALPALQVGAFLLAGWVSTTFKGE